MTIQNTDLFLVSNNGSKKCEAQNLNGKTGNVLVNRGGASYKTGIENIPTTVLDTDLMLVNRGGASFKATGAEVQTLFPQGPAGATDVITDVVNSGSTSTRSLRRKTGVGECNSGALWTLRHGVTSSSRLWTGLPGGRAFLFSTGACSPQSISPPQKLDSIIK